MKRSVCVFVLAMLFGGIASAVDAAKFLRPDVALILSDGHVLRSWWIEGGAFSDVLQRERQERQLMDLIGHKNIFDRDDLKRGARKKVSLTFSPRVFIRPVMIIEELQALLVTYQSQGNAFFEGNAQAKTMLPFGAVEVIPSPRIFSFVPCYLKIYGVYLQILW